MDAGTLLLTTSLPCVLLMDQTCFAGFAFLWSSTKHAFAGSPFGSIIMLEASFLLGSSSGWFTFATFFWWLAWAAMLWASMATTLQTWASIWAFNILRGHTTECWIFPWLASFLHPVSSSLSGWMIQSSLSRLLGPPPCLLIVYWTPLSSLSRSGTRPRRVAQI